MAPRSPLLAITAISISIRCEWRHKERCEVGAQTEMGSVVLPGTPCSHCQGQGTEVMPLPPPLRLHLLVQVLLPQRHQLAPPLLSLLLLPPPLLVLLMRMWLMPLQHPQKRGQQLQQ